LASGDDGMAVLREWGGEGKGVGSIPEGKEGQGDETRK